MTDATLNNIKLELETISDSFSKAIAKRHIPFSDDTHLTDMGLKERNIKLRCYFWDDTYEAHKDLLKLLWGETDFELNHPEYGLLKGKVENINVRDDDRQETAEIDLDFVVGKSKIAQAASMDIQGESEDLYVSGINEVQQNYRDNLVADSVLPVEIIDLALDPDNPTILEQMPATLTPDGRAYIKDLDKMLAAYDTTVAGITAPVDSLVKEVTFGMGIPGRVIGTIAGTVEKYNGKYNTLMSSPSRFINSLVGQISRFQVVGFSSDSDAIILPDTMTANAHGSVSALGASATLGKIYADDEALRAQRKRLEGIKAFDDLGRPQNIEQVESPMNVREIESTLYAVRELNGAAVESNREITSVKLLSDRLLDHVVKTKLDSEKIISIEVDNEMPLHLVCLKYGLPYQAADRIMLINRIRHPNFTRGGVDIYES